MNKYTLFLFLLILFTHLPFVGFSQGQDQLPVREYTSPDEIVTFDRQTPFTRAIDVINQFAQKKRGKVIIDRTKTEGSIGISIPPMHWRDALHLILSVKNLVLVERKDYYEIVEAPKNNTKNNLVRGPQTITGAAPEATTDTREVRINAIFFEGNRRALQEIGVDWSTLTENVPSTIGSYVNQGGGGSGGGSGGGGSGQLPATSFDGPFVQVNSKGAQSVSQDVFNSLINFGEIGNSGIQVQALFSAFEADNLGEILASPSIKVMDGEQGRIQVGQDFSIKQKDFAGNVTDQFFSVGTILTVTPQIVEQGDTTFIHLQISAERSSAQPDPVSTIVNKQQAETQAILLDGEATVIAGLYRSEKAEVRKGIPLLKDLPPWFFGLRYLFGYSSKDFIMRELVILIQASIEPSIPERYARNDLPNKFDVLQKERDRYKNEILEQEQSNKFGRLLEKDEPQNETPPPAQTSSKMQQPKTEQKKVIGQAEPDRDSTSQNKDTEINDDRMKRGNSDIKDPEVTTKPVTLNFDEDNSTDDSYAKDQMNSSDNETAVGGKTGKNETINKSNEPSTMPQSTGSGVMTAGNDHKYFIIGGSFKSTRHARQFRNKLEGEGFDPQILSTEHSDFMFVSYRGFNDFQKAKMILSDIKENNNKNAWLYKSHN